MTSKLVVLLLLVSVFCALALPVEEEGGSLDKTQSLPVRIARAAVADPDPRKRYDNHRDHKDHYDHHDPHDYHGGHKYHGHH